LTLTLTHIYNFVSISLTGGGLRVLTQSVPVVAGIAGDLGGMTLVPGTYTAAAAISLTGTLTLDADGVDDAKWFFVVGAAVTTAATSKIQMITAQGNPSVEWDVTGAISIGAGSHVIGSMKASGAIAVGASATCGALDSAGAIALGAGATSGDLESGGAITLGAGAQSGDLVAVGAITLGAEAEALSASSDAAITLGAGAKVVGYLASDLGGMTLVPGTYTVAAAIALTGTLILDGTGVNNPQWTFKIGGALTTAAASKMVFKLDADSNPTGTEANVLWDITGAITTGAGSTAIGKMMASGAITLGAGATSGALDAGGAITVGAGAVYLSANHAGALTLGAGAHERDALPDLPADLVGMTYVAGNYKTATATSLTGVLTLDAEDNVNAEWTFTIGGALTTAAASKMVFKDGVGSEENVHWVVTGAISLGASSTAIGEMKATGAINVGAGATTSALDAGGALNVGAGAVYLSAKHAGALALGAGSRKRGDQPDLPGDLVGMTYVAGNYKTATATSLTGVLTLDAEDNVNAEWTFTIGGALATAAASKMVFKDGVGSEENVHWVVTGAISLGASSTAIGDMTATGAITLGAGAASGALNAGGAVTVGAGGVYLSTAQVGALTLGAGAHAVGDLPDLPADMGSMILVPGTYKTAAATGLTGTLTLDANGVTNPEWFFNIGGALTTAAASKMVGGTDANVHWVVTGAITTGAGSTAVGSMKASGAITVGAIATCGALTADGAITVGAGAIYKSVSTNAAETIGAGAIQK
jgi:hypothetical protein